ncbi:MAG: glycoside hydrolase family 127 protein [Muribaculaceae bacterium]|nr:glycoside hydrolase family 127 protein [Muribaculaceae bacterium]
MKKILIPLFLTALVAPASIAQSELYPEHFNLEEVVLNESPLLTAMERNFKLLMEYDAERLLTPFIRQAGLSTKSDSKYYGWVKKHPSFTNWGDQSWSLEGHIGGHYLSALALAYAACNDSNQRQLIKERLDYLIDVLEDCQKAFDGNTEGMEGFIGGQPINHIWTGLYKADLEPFRQYGGWVPFYCQHKVLAGLRDAWIYADNAKAKELFRKLSDWSVNMVKNLSDSQIDNLLGWEHGGMNETLIDAYRLFGDKKYLNAAKKFSHKHELNGMSGTSSSYSKTFLNGQHANTQVPKFIGFERIYQEASENTSYRSAAHNFWDDVATHRTVCIGGNSVSEHFLPQDRCSEYINNLEGPESCNSNNMLKLSENLFDETHDARYADFYESTMWNHILSTQDPTTGGYVYFTSLRPQSYRIYSKVNQGMWCCVGTGMENHSKYGHFVFTHAADNSTLYVNLFTPCELKSENFGLIQETRFPFEPQTRLTVTKGGKYTLAIRHPSWTTDEFAVKVNGKEEQVKVEKGKASYIFLQRDWQPNDIVTVDLPMELRYEECPNYTDYIAFKYGPILLAARTTASSAREADALGLQYEALQNEYGGEGRMDHSPGVRANAKSLSSAPLLIGDRKDVLKRISIKDADKLLFSIDASSDESKTAWTTLTLEPFYGIHHSRYSCYWYQQTPEAYQESDMGKADAAEKLLTDRTIDFVATGEQQSEAGHEAKHSPESTTGQYRGEFYRDARKDGYIEYHLYNPEGETKDMAVMCRFTIADNGRRGIIYIDGISIADFTVPENHVAKDDNGFFNMEFPIPEELMIDENGNAKTSIVFRISSPSTICPGLYYLRLLRGYVDLSYKFVATDWTTGDVWRVGKDKFKYLDDNTFTVNAGTGDNNVCLMLDYNSCDYNVMETDRYLVVKGSNLNTGNGKSYLWWLNGINYGSSVAPTIIEASSDGDTIIAWDITKSGLDGNCKGNPYSISMGQTIFGLTSTTGTSHIKYVGFLKSIKDIPDGVDTVYKDSDIDPDSIVDIFTIDGKCVSKGITFSAARNSLPRGIYIIGGKKIIF